LIDVNPSPPPPSRAYYQERKKIKKKVPKETGMGQGKILEMETLILKQVQYDRLKEFQIIWF
jgi:hypothetical protein